MKKITTIILIFSLNFCYTARRNILDRLTFLRSLMDLLYSEMDFNFSYSQTYLEFTKGLPIPKISPRSNKKIFSCNAQPSLPEGIVLATNCEISGTPQKEKAFTNYKIQAVSESGELASFMLGIVVTSTPPSNLQYPTNSLTFTVGISIPPQTPTYVGTITTCSSNPPLPSGLSLSSNCEITGVPSTTQGFMQYTITGANSFGETSTNIQISITADPPSGLSYYSSPFIFSLGIMISPQTPALVGVATSCSASPPLPTGLTLDQATCTLSGTPTSLQSYTIHTITASNLYGSSSIDIGITVNHVPPSSLTYPSGSYSLTEFLPIAPITPTYSGTITNCVATPTLPTGLMLNTTTCEITGTPTVLQSATSHTITASNTGGSTSTTLSIAVLIAPPSALSYTPASYTFTQGIAITPITPTYSGTITNCVATPPLPVGLMLNTTNCQITGTPTVIQSATNHTITASNSSGSTTATINITVNIASPSGLTYTPTTYTFIKNVAITPVVPTFSGTVTSCTASPSLPTGLLINNTTCQITGTPTALQTATSYTITASNMSGSTTATITIAVELLPPSGLSYAGTPYTLFKDVATTPITPSVSGTVTSCSSSPTLPAGLSLHPTTCAISGTPTTPQPFTSYNITASNSYGSTYTTIQIRVNKGVVYMAIYNSSIKRAKRYNNATTLSGSSLVDFGSNGYSFAVAVDRTKNILYVARSSCSTPDTTIEVYDNADTNPGTMPSRTFTHTDMVCPGALVVDETNDRLYIVVNYDIAANLNRKIFRLENASTASGTLTLGTNFRKINVSAFDASVQGIRRATLWGDSLYVCDYGQNKVFVFDNISSYANNSNATPSRTINPGNGPAGIAIDTANNLLFVSMFAEDRIKVFANANTVAGTPIPIRTITSGSSLDGPVGIYYYAPLNRLYVGSFNTGTLMYFDNANTLNGSVTPNATLTGLTSISDVDVDFTR